MSVNGVNSQTRPIQTFQTQNAGFAQPAAQQQPALDPMAALTKALEALEQAVSALSSKGFGNNNQSVASQANQNLGTSGAANGNNFDFSNLFQGGSTFDHTQPQQTNFAPPAPPVQQQAPVTHANNSFLDNKGGGSGDAHLNFGDKKSGGGSGIRVGSDGANN